MNRQDQYDVSKRILTRKIVGGPTNTSKLYLIFRATPCTHSHADGSRALDIGNDGASLKKGSSTTETQSGLTPEVEGKTHGACHECVVRWAVHDTSPTLIIVYIAS